MTPASKNNVSSAVKGSKKKDFRIHLTNFNQKDAKDFKNDLDLNYIINLEKYRKNLINKKKNVKDLCLLSELITINEGSADYLLKITGADHKNGSYLDPTVEGTSVCRKFKLVKTGLKKGKIIKKNVYGRRLSEDVSCIYANVIKKIAPV